MSEDADLLQVLVLGPPQIRWRGKPVVIQRRVPRALLFFLATQRNPVGREELLTLFWEDSPEASARSRLRETLHRLRRALPDPTLLLLETDVVSLDFQRVYVDLHHAKQLAQVAAPSAWGGSPHTPLAPSVAQSLQDVLRLWRGEHFLAGAKLPSSKAFDEWLTRMTQHTDLLRLTLLERLARHAQASGDLTQAIRLARLMVEQDGTEEHHAYLVELLIEADRLDEARRQLEQAQRALQKAQNILSPTLETATHKLRNRSSAKRSPAVQWNIRSSLATPFVGRQANLAQLERLWRTGGVVFLLGESGLGKTRLLQEFASRLSPPARVALTTCRPSESQMPFQPLVDIIRRYLDLTTLMGVSERWISIILPLVPDLATTRPKSRPLNSALANSSRSLIFEALRQLTLPICRTGKILWVLDDAQWADPSTLDAAAYIVERPPFDRDQLVVFAARSEEISPHLETFMASLQATYRATVIHLSRLSLLEVATLANNVLGQMPSPQFTERLAGDTGGNPLFILETLQALLAQNPTPDLSQPIQMPLAKNVEALLNARLRALSPLAREIIEAAAILGTFFDPTLLQAITSHAEAELARGLHELESKALIESDISSPGKGGYHFLHDKIRETLLRAMHPLRVRQLHERAGRALEAAAGEQTESQAAVLAQHFEQAGLQQAAFDYWLEAAAYSRRLFSTQEAIHAFERAEQLARQLETTLPDTSLYRLYAGWSKILFENDTADPLEAVARTWLEWGRKRNSPFLIGAALIRLSDADFVRGNHAAGLEHVNQAFPYLLQGSNLIEKMEAYTRQGLYLYMLGRWAEAQASFESALAFNVQPHQVNLLPARAEAEYHLALLHNLTGWPAVALVHGERMLSIQIASGDLHGQVVAYSVLSLIRYFLGEYLQAQADNQFGLELAERLQAWRMLGYLHAYRSMIELALGHVDDCLQQAEQAIEIGERYRHDEIAAVGYRVIGDVYIWLDRPAQAAEYYGRALQASRGGVLASDPMFRLGAALCLSGEMERGQAHLSQAIAIAEQTGLGLVLVMAQACQAWVYLSQGAYAKAHDLALKVIEETSRRQITTFRLFTGNILGKIALACADFPFPMQTLQTHAAEAARANDPWMELEIQTLIAQMQRRANLPDERLTQRILHLLDQLAAQITRQPFTDCFALYRQGVIEKI